MTTETRPATPPTAQPDQLTARRWPRWIWWFAAAVLLATTVLRFLAFSPLWLDEAQSVEIARRSLPHLFDALRHDGSPPLYYVLLHGWIHVFGTGSFAVRSLSGVAALLALPLVFLVTRRFGGDRRQAWVALLLLAANPFAIRYATETRMYSLLTLLTLVFLLVFRRIWLDGGVRWIAVGAVVVAVMLLTHYWSLFLVLVTGIGAVVAMVRGFAAGRRVLVALAVGCLGFVPWLPSFVFQLRHTGAPWGSPPSLADAFGAPSAWAGSSLTSAGHALALIYYLLVTLGLVGRVTADGVVLGRPLRRHVALLAGAAFATLAAGTLVNEAVGSAYAARYTAIALGPFIAAAAFGFRPLPIRWRTPAVVGVVALGVAISSALPAHERSQADEVADLLQQARPTDLVVFCPDQLGPAVSRLAPHAGRQVVFPTMRPPQLVDWVDYKQRNEAADPAAFVRRALNLVGPTSSVWLVYRDGYPTFHDDCSQLLVDIASARGAPDIVLRSHGHVDERARVALYRPRSG